MKKALIPAFLLVLASTVFGATVFREPIAWAAAPIASVFVTNDESSPVPVREQNVDADGNIKVHEQGTVDVKVANRRVPPPEHVTGGGGKALISCPSFDSTSPARAATALHLGWSAGVELVVIRLGNSEVAEFWGPARTGDPSSLVLPLARPVAFDAVECYGTGQLYFDWVGDEP